MGGHANPRFYGLILSPDTRGNVIACKQLATLPLDAVTSACSWGSRGRAGNTPPGEVRSITPILATH